MIVCKIEKQGPMFDGKVPQAVGGHLPTVVIYPEEVHVHPAP
jgi:hypothetical protein